MLAKRMIYPNQADSNLLDITATCPVCNQPHTVTVSNKGYAAWKDGVHIQDALPELPADQREILITGIDDRCWKAMFQGED